MPSIVEDLERAIEHQRTGELAEAAALYRQVLSREPDHPDALHLLGVIARRQGRPAEAADLIRAAIAISPAFHGFHRNLAQALRDLGDLEGEIACHRRALALVPDDAEANEDIATVLAALADRRRLEGRLEEALPLCVEATDRRPDWGQGLRLSGLVHHLLGRYAEAEALYRRYLAIHPDDAAVENNLRDALVRQGRRGEAVEPLRARALARLASASGRPPAEARQGAVMFADVALPAALPTRRGEVQMPTFASPTQRAAFLSGYLKSPDLNNAAIGYVMPEGRMVSLDGGAVAGRHSTLFDGGGRVLIDFFTDDLWLQNGPELVDDIAAAGEALAGGAVATDDREAVLATAPWAGNYYHFLTEAVPRLLLTRQALGHDGGAVVVPHDRPFQRQLLDLLGIAEDARIPVDGVCRRFRRLHALGPFQNTMAMRGEAAAVVRAHLLPAVGGAGGGRRRLYVSRADSARKVVNEDEVFAALRPLGFERVVCGELSVADQIRTFAGAEVVVGAHGANLTNILFMPAGGAVVEMMSPHYITQPYWVIANLVGARYGLLLCRDADEANLDLRNRDMIGDVPGLLALLANLGVA